MITTYKNQVEALLMQDDVEDGLGLTDVQFTGEHVLENDTLLFLEVEITDAEDVVTTHWVALKDSELLFADERPEGVQIPPVAV